MTKLWIRVDASAPDDPSIQALGDRLEIDPMKAFGHVVALWCVISEHARSGDLSAVTDATLERWARWTKRKGAFAAVFRSLFVDESGQLHGWSSRQGALIDRAERDRQRWHKRTGNSAETPRSSTRNSAEENTQLRGDSASTERNGTEQRSKARASAADAATRKRGSRSLVPSPDEEQVLEHYRAAHPGVRALGDQPIQLVRKAMALGYTVPELFEAIDGNKGDTWHADRKKHELDYVLRDASHIDRFRLNYADQHTVLTDADVRRLIESPQ